MAFFFISISVLILAYVYMGRRLITTTALNKSKKHILWLIFFPLSLLMPLSFLVRFTLKNNIFTDILGWVAYITFGFFSIVVAFLLLTDLVRLFSFLFKRVKSFFIKSKSESKNLFDPERRQFMIASLNFGILGASAIMTGYGLYEARRRPILHNIDIPIFNLSPEVEGLKIAQFTDLHVGPTIKRHFVQSVINQINGLEADIIVCTGDLVDDLVPNIRDDVAPIKDLYAPKGVYFVTGNHEYYVGAMPWLEEIEKLGMTVLVDENRTIEYNSQSIILAGVSDYRSKQFVPHHKSDPKAALLNSADGDVKILLAHQPRSIFAASEVGYDLQISGHTHGGQYFPWSMFVTLGQPYVSGLHKHHNTWIYVNRGTGYWGPPMRLGVPSEVTLFTFTNQKTD